MMLVYGSIVINLMIDIRDEKAYEKWKVFKSFVTN